MTLNDPADFENQDVLLNQMKSAKLTQLDLKDHQYTIFQLLLALKW